MERGGFLLVNNDNSILPVPFARPQEHNMFIIIYTIIWGLRSQFFHMAYFSKARKQLRPNVFKNQEYHDCVAINYCGFLSISVSIILVDFETRASSDTLL